MWYVIYSKDRKNSLEARKQNRESHLERAIALRDQGRLLLAGPRPSIDADDPGPAGFQGSLIVAEFDSLEDAQSWADADPYVSGGVYESYEVSPFLRVMPV